MASDELFFFGDSETGKIARTVKWSATALGTPEHWPDCLKLILGMMYGNQHPVCLFWGPEHYYFYNDGYIPIVGASKHPWAVGKKGEEVWGEIWSLLLPQITLVLNGKGATWNEDQYIPVIGDKGKARDAFFTYSYSPVYEVTGKINGVLVTCTETTKRIVTEKKLRESQESLQLALSSAKMGFWEVNLVTTKVILSKEAKEIFGVHHDSVDAAIDDFIHPDDRDHAREVLRRAIESKRPYDDVYRIIRPTGDIRWINSKGQARYDYNGKPIFLAGLSFDITEKKVSQEELEASEQRFRQIGETLPQLVWTARADGYCDYLSRQWGEYTGIPVAEQVGMGWLDKVIHPDDRQKTLEHYIGAINDKHPYDTEYRIRRADGIYRWFKVRATSFRNAEGKITHWFGTCTDIQDAKEAQIKYEKNVDTSPAMLWITEKDGYCSYLSQHWYKTTGQTPETGLGFGWLTATHPDDMERTRKIFSEASKERKPFYLEYRLRNKDGDYRWSIDAGNPRFNEEGEFLGYAGTVIDIHDMKMAELHMSEALRARDEFLSIASHELKTPLTTLRLQVDLQKKSLKKYSSITVEKFENFLKLTDKQTTRISRLVEDMLDVARIRTGKLTMEWEPIDLCELVSDVILRLSDQFEKDSYAIPQVPKCADATGTWDRMRLEQIVTNLLTNAIKYGRKNPISVNIHSDENHVTLVVTDKGIGIQEKDKSKIFDRFERAVSANDISGLGLGLYITKQIVQSFQGEIAVESKLGEGSVFEVKLPKRSNSIIMNT